MGAAIHKCHAGLWSATAKKYVNQPKPGHSNILPPTCRSPPSGEETAIDTTATRVPPSGADPSSTENPLTAVHYVLSEQHPIDEAISRRPVLTLHSSALDTRLDAESDAGRTTLQIDPYLMDEAKAAALDDDCFSLCSEDSEEEMERNAKMIPRRTSPVLFTSSNAPRTPETNQVTRTLLNCSFNARSLQQDCAARQVLENKLRNRLSVECDNGEASHCDDNASASGNFVQCISKYMNDLGRSHGSIFFRCGSSSQSLSGDARSQPSVHFFPYEHCDSEPEPVHNRSGTHLTMVTPNEAKEVNSVPERSPCTCSCRAPHWVPASTEPQPILCSKSSAINVTELSHSEGILSLQITPPLCVSKQLAIIGADVPHRQQLARRAEEDYLLFRQMKLSYSVA